MRSLIWESGQDRIVMTDDINDAIFADFSEFTPNTVSGVYDRKTVFGLNGTVLVNAQLSNRQCVVKATVMAHNIGSATDPVKAVLDRYRRILCRAADPTRRGRLTYRNNSGEVFFIEALPQSLPVFSSETPSTITFLLDLVADEPYWQLEEQHSVEIGKAVTAAQLPATLPMTLATVTAMTVAVENNSDVPVHPTVRVNPTPLPVMLTNHANGKRLAMSAKVDDGYYAIIKTTHGGQEVRLWRESVLGDEMVETVTHWLAPQSDTDFALEPGSNLLTINDTLNAEGAPTCVVTWHDARMGV